MTVMSSNYREARYRVDHPDSTFYCDKNSVHMLYSDLVIFCANGDVSESINTDICISAYCASTDFRCANGIECIRPCARCDGVSDCSDSSDELNCSEFTLCL